MSARDDEAPSVLTAFYDLSVSPTGFDFAVYLALADLARQRRGFVSFRVIFVPAGGDGFWKNESYNVGYKAWRLHHLLLPLTTLFPRCAGTAICGTRDDARVFARAAGTDVFPDRYTLENPPAEAYQWAHFVAALTNGESWQGWEAPAPAIAFVDQWLEPRARGRKIVTITLREARYHVEHNSNRDAWTEFARGLDPERYFPVFLRDTETTLDPTPRELAQLTLFAEPAFNVALRAALYVRAHVNLMTASGPMYLAWLNPHCATLVFRMLDFSDYRATPASLGAIGFDPGATPSFLQPRQRVVWADDDLETIREAFIAMEEKAVPKLPPEPPLTMARRLRRHGRHDAALQVYDRLVEAGSDLTRLAAAAGRAQIEFSEKRHAGLFARFEARIALERLPIPRIPMQADDAGVSALLEIIDWLLLLDRPETAQSVANQVTAEYADTAKFLYLAGDIELRLNHPAKALSHLRRASSLEPWSAVTRYAHGIALLVQGEDDLAKAEFVAAAQNDPSHEASRLRVASLDPDCRFADGFRYEDALARRRGDAADVIGEIDYLITLPDLRQGYRVAWFRGRFHAVPDKGLSLAFDWHTNRIVYRAPHRPRTKASTTGSSPLSSCIRILGRKIVQTRRRPAPERVITAPTLAELDSLLARAN